MEFERKPPSLLELCVRNVIDNLRYVDNMDGVEMQLLKRIMPHCTLEQLTRIESRTDMDISPVTDVLWKRFYQQQFGEDNMNLVVKKMKQSGARYKWKDLFKAKTEKQKEVEEVMGERLRKKYQAQKAERESKQIKICTKVPPSSKRSWFGGSGGSSSLSNSSYKSPILKKARMEVDSRAKMQATIQRNTFARSSQPTRMTSPNGQPLRSTTIHRPNSTITITKPTGGLNRPVQKQNTRPKF
ncbi:hypothetical protein QYE76_032730 [Lolium multiflorum]|uniref:Elongin-A n=1 Tax=Lolium multiflorum TaxID=4521 RepID=A0AAD8QWA0_LOLMU|nr:hypothetical protein QYE76_017242 [Lolium multiflorum]KAK1609057.1 hypothetical protein QYE76_032730 [Lolium multiflorum]